MHSTDQEWVGESGEPRLQKRKNIVGALKAAALKKACNALRPAQVRPRNSIAGRRGVTRQNPPRLH
jgi:hypothetical protein